MFKAVIAAALVAFVSPAFADTTDDLLAQAQASFAARAYTAAGVAKAQEAADLYAQLVAMSTDSKVKAKFLSRQSEALYFVGHAATSKKDKVRYHLAGVELGKEALGAFGITEVKDFDSKLVARLKSELSSAEIAVLAEAVYYRGIHLGQWGQANGVMDSLSKWPELRDSMLLVIELGSADIANYGPYRALARGYHKIPGMFGGDKAKAEKYLRTAIEKSRSPGKIYSTNGYTNIFLAELLIDTNREAEAKQLLQAFVTASDSEFNQDSLVESKHAQKEAQELLEEM